MSAIAVASHHCERGESLFAGLIVDQNDRITNLGMPTDRRRDLARLDAKAANLHLVVRATEKLDCAVGQYAGEIAGAIHAIRWVSGERIEDETLFCELGRVQIPARDRTAARAHDRAGAARDAKWHVYPELAAAGLWTTSPDLARFGIELQKSLQGKSNRVLNRAMANEMASPVGVGPFAMGMQMNKTGEGWYLSHGGSNWGFQCLLFVHKVKGYGFAAMTNADSGGRLIAELQQRVAAAYKWDMLDQPLRR